MNSDQAHRRAEALFKKEQQARESQQARAHYQAELYATREKTARLRALRLARDAANQGGLPAGQKDAAQLAKNSVWPKKGLGRGKRQQHRITLMCSLWQRHVVLGRRFLGSNHIRRPR